METTITWGYIGIIWTFGFRLQGSDFGVQGPGSGFRASGSQLRI